MPELEPLSKKKRQVKQGPTTRSHRSQQSITIVDDLPSDEEGTNGDLEP